MNVETVHVFDHRVPTTKIASRSSRTSALRPKNDVGSSPTCDVAPKGDVGSSRTSDLGSNCLK